MRDGYFLDYCLFVVHLRRKGYALAEAQKIANDLFYEKRPEPAADLKSEVKRAASTAVESPPQSKEVPRIIVSQPQVTRLPATIGRTRVHCAIPPGVHATVRIEKSSSPRQRTEQIPAPHRSQTMRLPAVQRKTQITGATRAMNRPMPPPTKPPQVRASPTQILGLFLNYTEPVIEVAHAL